MEAAERGKRPRVPSMTGVVVSQGELSGETDVVNQL